MDTILTILLAALASGGLFTFLQFLINRKDLQKKEETRELLHKINVKIDKLEKDSVRTQMLVMMNHYPDDTKEIMKLAQHYCEMGGNWYMTSLFKKWLKENNLEEPEWFDSNE